MAKRWSVSVPWHAEVIVKVEADTEAQAIDKAERRAWPSLCYQCSREVVIGEANTEFPSEATELPEEEDSNG